VCEASNNLRVNITPTLYTIVAVFVPRFTVVPIYGYYYLDERLTIL